MRQDTDNRNVDALDKKGGRNGTFSQKTRLKGTKTYNSNFTKNHQGWSSNEKRKCFRCGYYQGHSKEQCPAKDAICNKCRKKGHFAKVCHTKTIQEVSSSEDKEFNGIVGKQENTEVYFGYLKTEKADKNIFAVSKKIEVNEMFQAFFGIKKAEVQIEHLHRFKRLPSGIPSAPEHFQKRISQILEGLEGTLCHMDDILVYGSCQEEHDKILEAVLTRLSKSGLTLNKDKCKFAVIQLLSAVIWQTKDGLRQVITYASRTLSETERRYAQIDKEALTITWACEKFKQYIQGLVINLETDHKPLVPIFTSKNIDDLTPRIQRLRLRMMRYSYKILHEPGKNLIVADALPRSPWIKVGTQELEEELCAYVQQVVSFMPISDVREGWPERTNVSMSESQYWPVKDDFSVENGILLKGSIYVIPENIRKGLHQRIHEGHLGIVKCRERAKGSVWWTQITSEIEEMVRTCPMCIEERTNRHQPLLPSEFPSCPWEKVEVDLFTIKDQNYLLITDYYSKYPEIERLKDMTSASVIVHCMSIFARHGIPLEVQSDNGPQFGSLFKEFAQDYGFTHVTSSPRYPQSNGFIETFIKLLKKELSSQKIPIWLCWHIELHHLQMASAQQNLA
ncbi:K02A2.6-like [Cordylochernes scorpioides]|uniref:RNA-directed DNA polymerase n=1 Tax=Cordylochernes scorpioides TaxID=51811 RepID=A0ABY6KCD5_9ARAC|nr:K02A2.6-like [Cordylochernes scorpioides]